MKEQRQVNNIPPGMRCGRRELNSASVLVGMCAAVPEKMRATTREISHLQVPLEDRRKRYATMLMNFVCQEADANGITLVLLVSPDGETEDGKAEGTMNEPQLIAWYERFGFNVLQDTHLGAFMARRVHVEDKPSPLVRLAVNNEIARGLTKRDIN